MDRSVDLSDFTSGKKVDTDDVFARSRSAGKKPPPPMLKQKPARHTFSNLPNNKKFSNRDDSEIKDYSREKDDKHHPLDPTMSLPASTSALSRSSSGECPKHSHEKLKYYCPLHDELVCADCLALEPRHQGHRHTRADALAEEYRSSLQSQLQPLQEMLQNSRDALQTMESRRKEITENGDSVRETIKTAIARLHTSLETREQELFIEADKLTQQKLKHHDAHQSYLDGLTSELAHVVTSVTQSTTDNSSNILYHHKRLSDWVLEVTRKFQSLPKEVFLPLQGANMSFTINAALMDTCRKVGTVNERQADPLRCYIDESAMNSITVNQPAVLQLITNSSDGKPYTNHINGIKVELIALDTNKPTSVTIEQDVAMGHQYNLTFTPTEVGEHLVTVKIGSTAVNNCPLSVMVGSVVSGTLVGDIKGVLQPYGLTLMENREVVVVENGKDCVTIFRQDGKQLRSITGKGKQKLNRPRGVAILPSNELLITDDDGLKSVTLEGKHMTLVGKLGSGQLEFSTPGGIALDSDGKIYVCDTFNGRLQVLNSDLSFCQYFGTDLQMGKLGAPYDITFSKSGRFYIADYSEHSIKIFSPTGKFIGQITEKANGDILKNPVSVHINSNDHLLVGEEKIPGISVFDYNGKYLSSIAVKVAGAYGITSDTQGQTYISDRTNRRVQILK